MHGRGRLGSTCEPYTVERWRGSDRMSYVDTLPANSTTSLQRDIAEGKPSELDYWNGSVVRQERAVKIPTPVNEFIYYSVLPQELRARGAVVFPQ